MAINKNISSANLYTSLLDLNERYYISPDHDYLLLNSPVCLSHPLLASEKSPDIFSTLKINYRYDFSYFKKLIEHPADTRHILWPADIIRTCPYSRIPVLQGYLSDESAPRLREVKYDLLFHSSTKTKYWCLSEFTDQTQNLNWKNPDLLSLASKICLALHRINTSGYIYTDFSFSRFFLRDDNVVLDFSNLIFPLEYDLTDNELCGYTVEPSDYPQEFTKPSLVQGKQSTYDLASQNHSLAAMLFYLFFGRYPYDGRLLDGYSSDTQQNHMMKFRAYHQSPYFVFEENETDNPNRLGGFLEDQIIINSWNELPADIQHSFRTMLNFEYASERSDTLSSIQPSDWLQLFSRYFSADADPG